MSSSRSSAPLCGGGRLSLLDDGVMCRPPAMPLPVGGIPCGIKVHESDVGRSWSYLSTPADEAEFEAIKKFPSLDYKGHAYIDLQSYLSDRERYFGFRSDYESFAAESDAELINTKWRGKKKTTTLRATLPPELKTLQEQKV